MGSRKHKEYVYTDIESTEELMTEMVKADYAEIRRSKNWLMFHRIASGTVASFYILSALLSGDMENVFNSILFLVLPLSAILFSDEMGSQAGTTFGGLGGPVVTKVSPGSLLRFVGWLLLLMPIYANYFGYIFWK